MDVLGDETVHVIPRGLVQNRTEQIKDVLAPQLQEAAVDVFRRVARVSELKEHVGFLSVVPQEQWASIVRTRFFFFLSAVL